VVPAKQQIDLPVHSTINSLKLCNGTFATEPRSIQKGVYIGRTLLPAAHHEIAVRVINTTSEPRLIKGDTYTGLLKPISVINETDDSSSYTYVCHTPSLL